VRLSEEKVHRIAARLAEALASRPDLMRFDGSPGTLERDIARFLVADLRIEDEITHEALDRLKTYSRKLTPGDTEWTLLLEKHKEEIAARRGYVIS
jgi:hypothetical protein